MTAYLRPVDLARRAGLRPSQIRNYERDGVLPPAERSPTGYRRYTEAHAEALRLARVLMAGYGWQVAVEAMRAVNRRDRSTLLAVIDGAHARLAARRERIRSTLRALDDLQARSDAFQRRRSVLGIGAAAEQAGVRVSALRYWETQGLLSPTRDAAGNRRYDAAQQLRLRVVILLRGAGYRFPAIRTLLDELGTDQPAQARRALQAHRRALDDSSERAALATATVWEHLQRLG